MNMDTNRIKRFATEARNILKAGIAAKMLALGFDKNGDVAEENKPRLMQGGSLWNGQLQTEGFYHQWTALYKRIRQIGVKDVCEEAAYTWFNRLCAIRILQKNNLCQPVLAYADAARTPVIVDEARQGRIPRMKEEMRGRLMELLDDDTKVTEQFAVLITAWCHDNPIINRCFGGIADYTELLLPNNILADGGFVDLLNHTEFITDEDFRSPELIGWLYQFYISERKDEVFAKKGKFEADEIPAATQIFTPNWIVKYMVQNTVGRIYLDNNPYETRLQKKWQYLVEPAEKPGKDTVLEYDELTDLKVADLACGSGHILNECFDLLYDLYIAEGYSRTEAVESIFLHNLTGVDIDTRAKQLATFSLLLKACQKDAAFADARCMPNVLDMSGVVPALDEGALSTACLRFIGGSGNVAGEMLEQDFELLRDAGNLGSIMKFNDDEGYLKMLRCHYEDWTNGGPDDCPDDIKLLLPGVRVILALTDKYHALVMNPPYMGGGNMNSVLSKYVKDNYKDGKADLATVFVEMMGQRTSTNGSYAFIIPPSWMFLSTFEGLRKNIIENQSIESLLHLSRGVFGADFGASSAVIKNAHNENARGIYFRLVERTFQEFEQSHLRLLFEQTLADHDFKYKFSEYNKDVTELPYSEDGNRIYYPNVEQKNFEKIPGCPIGYWVSENMIKAFDKKSFISDLAISNGQNITGDNKRFIRLFWEVNNINVNKDYWAFCARGGGFRRYYGNVDNVILWTRSAKTFYHKDPIARIIPEELQFKSGITWSYICSGNPSFRKLHETETFEKAGTSIFIKDKDKLSSLLAFLNSIVAKEMFKIIAPTLNYQVRDIFSLPISDKIFSVTVNIRLEDSYSISKQDWDAHETSWDFQRNELLAIDAKTYEDNVRYEEEKRSAETDGHIHEHIQTAPAATPHFGSLEWRMKQYKLKWERNFMRLHANEEELNRLFIGIYGLQDELTPDVPLDEITILQQGEISIE